MPRAFARALTRAAIWAIKLSVVGLAQIIWFFYHLVPSEAVVHDSANGRRDMSLIQVILLNAILPIESLTRDLEQSLLLVK